MIIKAHTHKKKKKKKQTTRREPGLMPDWFLDNLVKETGLDASNFIFHGLIGSCHNQDITDINGMICNVSCYAYSQIYINNSWHGIMYYAWQKEMHESRYNGAPYYWHLKDKNVPKNHNHNSDYKNENQLLKTESDEDIVFDDDDDNDYNYRGNGEIDKNFRTVITMRYNASKNQLSFWKNGKQMIGENIKRIRWYQGRDCDDNNAFYGQKRRKQIASLKCPVYFENGIFNLDSGFTYYPMVASVGCSCDFQGGVCIGYDCD